MFGWVLTTPLSFTKNDFSFINLQNAALDHLKHLASYTLERLLTVYI